MNQSSYPKKILDFIVNILSLRLQQIKGIAQCLGKNNTILLSVDETINVSGK